MNGLPSTAIVRSSDDLRILLIDRLRALKRYQARHAGMAAELMTLEREQVDVAAETTALKLQLIQAIEAESELLV